jgi:hypothetical protein
MDLCLDAWLYAFSFVPARERAPLREVCRAWARALGAPGQWQDIPSEDKVRYLCRACQRSALAAAWAIGAFDLGALPKGEVMDFCDLADVCAGGLAVAQRVLDALGPERFGETHKDRRTTGALALDYVCRRGQLDVVRWLTKTFGLEAEDFREGGDGSPALCWACAEGHLGVAEWLVAVYGLTDADLITCAEDNDGLTSGDMGACARNDEGCTPQYPLLLRMCRAGHQAAIQWLVDAAGLTRDDIRRDGGAALRHACAGGHVALAQWLISRFDLRDAVRLSDVEALARASARDDIAQWLTATFG